VSFVLNGTAGHVSQETRDRVLRAASALGYVPNGSAQALRKGASRIALLNVEGIPTGSSLGGYIRGLDAELASHNHVLLVLHGHFSAQADVPVRYLVGQGHRHIATVLPDTPELRALAGLRDRLMRQAAQAAGPASCLTLVLPSSLGAAEERLRSFRADHPEVTAVAAYNDDTALVMLAAMREAGLRAPADLAVIGFDDTPHGALFSPALTTVHVDAEAIGRIPARNALGLPAGDFSPEPARVIVRQSG
jgi:DNA-binding LacI/PurR family transcriptional regulator